MEQAVMIIFGLALIGFLVVVKAISVMLRTIKLYLQAKLKLPKGS